MVLKIYMYLEGEERGRGVKLRCNKKKKYIQTFEVI
jgi:hypothetical protein